MSNSGEPIPVARFSALDILRGLAIFGMGFSSMVPYKGLTAWMYHAQLPPPDRAFNDQVFGITWVDLVFPFFLFSMGAAIPLALSKRLGNGEPLSQVIIDVLWRGFILAAYALIGNQLRPYVISDNPLYLSYLIGFLGAGLLVGMMFRFPKSMSKKSVFLIRIVSWLVSLIVISLILYPDNITGFANYRSDIILMVLANVSVSGSLIWMATRNKPIQRLLIFLLICIIFVTHNSWTISEFIWNFTPMQFFEKNHWPYLLDFDNWKYSIWFPIIYHFNYHKYLLITIPGLYCGDLILKMKGRVMPILNVKDQYAIALLSFSFLPICCVGLLARWVYSIMVLCIILSVALIYKLQLFKKIQGKMMDASLMDWFVLAGILLTFIGFIVEPVGGGIRKDEPTLSYFILTSGLAFLLCASISFIASLKKLDFTLLREAGQNPILGYIVITNIVPGVFALSIAGSWIDGLTLNPWIDTCFAFLKNVFVLYFAAYCTRRKWFIRA